MSSESENEENEDGALESMLLGILCFAEVEKVVDFLLLELCVANVVTVNGITTVAIYDNVSEIDSVASSILDRSG